MNIKLIGASLVLLLAVGAGGAAVGYGWGVAHEARASADRISKAESKVTDANGARDASVRALTEIRGKLAEQTKNLETARFYANAELEARTKLQAELNRTQRQRAAELQKVIHETPECADLVRMPLCPAVVERLWGITNHPAGSGH